MKPDDSHSFESLPDDQFADLAHQGFQDSLHIEAFIKEGVRRGIDPERLGDAFDQFIEECLVEVGRRYTELFTLLWVDLETDPHRCFLIDAKRWLTNGGLSQPTDDIGEEDHFPDWPWPITEPGEPGGDSGDENWHGQESSGLWICGYRVGVKGLDPLNRTRLLNHFFRSPLPPVVSRHFGDSYGESGSEKRLRRMANVMARNCRNFKRRSRDRYAEAIDDWEKDLAYLKKTYYRAGTFPWPSLDDTEGDAE